MQPDTIIAGISALIAVVSAAIAIYQTKKGWYIGVASPQRLDWAENLRAAVAGFASAFYCCEDLRSHRDKIWLYLNPNNESHIPLICAINNVCSGKSSDMDSVITEMQRLLRWNWWMVKAESGISQRLEKKRDKKSKERMSWYKL